MKLKNGNLQSTTEQNFILQQTLQQQQQMLHQETIRNCELEDSQTKLQKQVYLEQMILNPVKDFCGSYYCIC